jgi:hypothetical protein
LAAAVGISERTIGNLERGQSVSSTTLAAIENRLGWTPGSADDVLAGGEPSLVGEPTLGEQQSPPDPIITEFAEASPERVIAMRRSIERSLGPDAADEFMRAVLIIQRAAAEAKQSRPFEIPGASA